MSSSGPTPTQAGCGKAPEFRVSVPLSHLSSREEGQEERVLTLDPGVDKGRREIVVRAQLSAGHVLIVRPISVVLWREAGINPSFSGFQGPFPTLPGLSFPAFGASWDKKPPFLLAAPPLKLRSIRS